MATRRLAEARSPDTRKATFAGRRILPRRTTEPGGSCSECGAPVRRTVRGTSPRSGCASALVPTSACPARPRRTVARCGRRRYRSSPGHAQRPPHGCRRPPPPSQSQRFCKSVARILQKSQPFCKVTLARALVNPSPSMASLPVRRVHGWAELATRRNLKVHTYRSVARGGQDAYYWGV